MNKITFIASAALIALFQQAHALPISDDDSGKKNIGASNKQVPDEKKEATDKEKDLTSALGKAGASIAKSLPDSVTKAASSVTSSVKGGYYKIKNIWSKDKDKPTSSSLTDQALDMAWNSVKTVGAAGQALLEVDYEMMKLSWGIGVPLLQSAVGVLGLGGTTEAIVGSATVLSNIAKGVSAPGV